MPSKLPTQEASAEDLDDGEVFEADVEPCLKISSWNVNGIKSTIERGQLVRYVAREQPDVLCLQETKGNPAKWPPSYLDPVPGYPHRYWCFCDDDAKPTNGGYSGTAIFSKDEPLRVDYGMGVAKHDREGRLITAEFASFVLICAYVPNAGAQLKRLSYRMQWDEAFRAYIQRVEAERGKPVVYCGDLNVAHQPIDLANPKTNTRTAGFTAQEREGFTQLLCCGYVDAFRHLYPEAKGAYTFWSARFGGSKNRHNNVGWRLDYFVLSQQLTQGPLLDVVRRPRILGSDHCPLVLKLRQPNAPRPS